MSHRTLSPEHRASISRALRGKRNAAGPHAMSLAGSDAIRQAQRERWRRWDVQHGRKPRPT